MAIQKQIIQPREEKNYSTNTLQNVLNIIEKFETHSGAVYEENFYTVLCMHVIVQLSEIPIQRERAERYIADCQKIFDFFTGLPKCDSTRQQVLQKIYEIISVPEEKSVSDLVTIGLSIFPMNQIHLGVLHMLNSAICHQGNQEKGIINAITRLCKWQRFLPNNNLDAWVVHVIETLKTEKHTDVLHEIIGKNFGEQIISILLPVARDRSLNIVKVMLSCEIYTTNVLGEVAERSIKVLEYLKKNNSPVFEIMLHTILDYVNECPREIYMRPEYQEFLKSLNVLSNDEGFTNYNAIHKYPRLSNAHFNNGNRRVGLENLGNTCYLNSVLQALFMTRRFSLELLKLDNFDGSRDINAIQHVFALLSFSERNYINIKSAIQNIRPMDFIPGLQQDSSEFMGSLLDRLHEADKKSQKIEKNGEKMDVQEGFEKSTVVDNTDKSSDSTIIHKNFGGKISTTCKCSACNTESIIIDSFRDLALSFPEKEKNEENWDEPETHYNVQQLLDYYFQMEQLTLDGDNQYRCDNCKILCDGSRCTELLEAPKNLILTLKHFRYDPKFHTRSKLLIKHMKHDDNIKVKVKSSSGDCRLIDYQLYAAVVHSGMSLDSGHYYTFAHEKDSWFKFNDSFVSKVDISELHNLDPLNTPYILFYQRISKASSSPPNPSSNNESIDDTLIFEDLPEYLRKYVNDDNIKFHSENRRSSMQPIKTSFNTKSWNNDDDPPPSSCGNNFNDIQANRFIY
jgi:ubiquitin carboxyl-terminal hydrolase 35/38